jgi:hypothetical protein
VLSLVDGAPQSEDWPALIDGARPHEEHLDLSRLKALWSGAEADETASAAIAGTMAIALRAMGRAASVDEAEGMALVIWRERNKSKVPGAA